MRGKENLFHIIKSNVMKKGTCFLLLIFLVAGQLSAQDYRDYLEKVGKAAERLKLSQALLASNGMTSMGDESGFLLKNAAASYKLDSMVYWYYDDQAPAYVRDYKSIFSYDAKNLNTVIVSQSWNAEQGRWITDSRHNNFYNSKNQLSYMEDYYDESNTGDSLEFAGKSEVFYASSGRIDSMRLFNRDDEGVVKHSGTTYYTYNGAGKITEMKSWGYDDEGTWLYSDRNTFQYNAAGRLTQQSHFLMMGQEILSSTTTYSYNGAGQVAYDEYSSLDYVLYFMTGTVVMKKNSRYEYEYDSKGNLVVQYGKRWDEGLQGWVNSEKEETTYNLSVNVSDVIFPYNDYLYLYGFVEGYNEMGNMPTGTFDYSYIEGNYKNDGKSVYFYSQGGTSGVGVPGEARFLVYPNPARGTVIFRWQEAGSRLRLELYGADGVLLSARMIRSGETVPVDRYRQGLIVYRLLEDRQVVHSGKLRVE